ncbi:O-antigen ligase family protein [Crateriforma spongiae]|uniref:O-antigen ligase family protein n=1 Tax=Crateriforma spongiae TaxID=2724528 RepID=UPI0014459067|nr:O-antigen ligase family protein [Crateriforma spongiae]
MSRPLSIPLSSSAPSPPESRLEAVLAAPLAPLACALALLAAALVNPLDVGFRNAAESDSVGLDWQVALKLVVSGIAGGVGFLGFLTNWRVRDALARLPGMFFVALGFVFLGTSLFALDEVANVCRVAALIYCIYVLFIPTALSFLSLRTIVLMVLTGLVMHMVVSWFLYLFVPEIGVYEERLIGETVVLRMSGTAHPNSVGRVAVLAIVICIALLRGGRVGTVSPQKGLILYALIALAIATAIETKSRTAIAAGMASTIVMLIDLAASRFGRILAAMAGVGFFAAILVYGLGNGAEDFGSTIVSLGTKTGDASELTTATGRTVIWTEALSLIAQRPWTGWGLNSAPILLAEFSQHTHNLVLHCLFSGGIFAGILALVLVGWTLLVGLTSNEPFVRGISAYVLVSGMFEDTVFETFPFSSTLLWMTGLFAPVIYGNLASDKRFGMPSWPSLVGNADFTGSASASVDPPKRPSDQTSVQ